MNIGICLSGISYSTKGRLRDFRTTYQNLYETIYNPLSEHHSVSIYTTTYSHEFQEEILKVYNPKKHQFIPYENSTSRATYMSGLCLIEDEPLDVVISTRFDITFLKKISDMNVDFTKFNFLFKEKQMWDSHHFVTDNLFVFPYEYLYKFAEAVRMADEDPVAQQCTFMLHNVYDPVAKTIGEENIHFISPDVHEWSHDNTFYDLNRKNV